MTDTESLRVAVRDIRVAADIGMLAHEVGRLQALNLSVTVSLQPDPVDKLADTMDYNQIVAAAQALGRERIDLIETFARRLALVCLEHPRVLAVRVVVDKPGALPNGIASAEVALRR